MRFGVPVLRSAAWCVAAALIVLSVAPFGASAVERLQGDFWTYNASLEVMGYSVNASVTYSFLGDGTVSVNGTEYPVNVMRVSGGATQSVAFVGLEVSVSMGGLVYESKDKVAVVKDDMHLWINVTLGIEGFQLVWRSENQTETTYEPALLSGFDPDATSLGGSWTETVNATTTTRSWENGTLAGLPETSSEILSITYIVDPSLRTITTPAGTFDCLMITASTGSERVVYYWSGEVGNFVKEESYHSGDETPFTTMTLKDYKTESGLSSLVFVAIGGGLLAVALIVLAFVLMKRRKPPVPAESPPPPPAQ